MCDLPLCRVLLAHNARYPWLILSPRRQNCTEITDLEGIEAVLLWSEIRLASSILRAETGADKMNVAALGNMVRQLHVHVIARFEGDDAWPGPIWNAHPPVEYQAGVAETLIERLAAKLDPVKP